MVALVSAMIFARVTSLVGVEQVVALAMDASLCMHLTSSMLTRENVMAVHPFFAEGRSVMLG